MTDMTLSLSGFWELEEASGTRNDSHGANHLTDNNTVTQNTGIVGNAAEFVTANSESLSIADNASLGYSGDFSVAIWFYLTGTNHCLASKGNGSFAQNEWDFTTSFTSGRTLNFGVYQSGGTVVNASIVPPVPTNAWHLAIGTYEAATRIVTLSYDAGTRVTNTLASDPARKSQPFSLGTLGSNYWSGRLDQAGLWKRLLTEAEEDWLYNAGAGRSYAEVLATAGGSAGVGAGLTGGLLLEKMRLVR